jgi:hypothetical protein
VALTLNGLALLYVGQQKYGEAEPLLQRAVAIQEKALGPSHPALAESLENQATLLRKVKRDAEAAKLDARVKAIRTKQAPKP